MGQVTVGHPDSHRAQALDGSGERSGHQVGQEDDGRQEEQAHEKRQSQHVAEQWVHARSGDRHAHDTAGPRKVPRCDRDRDVEHLLFERGRDPAGAALAPGQSGGHLRPTAMVLHEGRVLLGVGENRAVVGDDGDAHGGCGTHAPGERLEGGGVGGRRPCGRVGCARSGRRNRRREGDGEPPCFEGEVGLEVVQEGPPKHVSRDQSLHQDHQDHDREERAQYAPSDAHHADYSSSSDGTSR